MRMRRALRVMARNSDECVSISTSEGLYVVALKDIIYVDILNHDLLLPRQ
jgi:hypothetical protein